MGLVAFGSSRLIALWDHKAGRVLATIKGHESTVTAVRFIGDVLISGSADSTLRLWSPDSDGRFNCFQIVSDVHKKTITSLAVFGDIVVSGSAEGVFCIWSLIRNESQVKLELVEEKTIGPRFYPISLAVHGLEENRIVIAVGGTSNDTYLFTGDIKSQSFTLDAKLSGHENWIRSLSFKRHEDDILLASASQDNYIRLWRIHKGGINTIGNRTASDVEKDDEALNELADTTGINLLSNKVYHIDNDKYTLTFEALLMGHDDWIYEVSWHPSKLELLSASSDSTLMFWSPDASSGIWICSTRLGDVSIKGASTATGASGGFWNALWLDDGYSVATIGRTGSWRIWSLECTNNNWVSQISISGHVRAVTDISWEDSGAYLLSTSLDQTTRLHSTWKKDASWHEISRPQIHGYDMMAVKSFSREVFVSAGDEKTLRVFEQPKGIAELMENVCGIYTSSSQKENLPESATVPVLGLSNKEEETKSVETPDSERSESMNDDENIHGTIRSTLSALTEPPKEDHLQRQTLWPELEKLYGHGYEISSIDISEDKTLLATSCRANNETHAVIRLYETKKWLQLKSPLSLHNLTITRLRFSPNGKYLLSVSRDRQWGLWAKNESEQFELVASNSKGHTRIIWDCAWLPDSSGFITASRDKSIKIWKINGDEWNEHNQIKFDAPVTAIDISANGILVVGLESGALFIYELAINSFDPQLVEQIDEYITPSLRVTRISWRPQGKQFAVASEDFILRLYSL
ncbi:Elongator subunit ELP2 [Sugiyamaella lignohabitans]|uniref:Elongator complex protein 2 n=1 Tax=Sugiyamaella lignohabitans TaxID=796027 RepID=A0A167FXU8_9ASCO|nr:Elongator subunit ELP2 [Sugiyamaella lignohabitans]ANB15839.1 Elongator subunit ELP2 [Sugiyamaella lignohabitans]